MALNKRRGSGILWIEATPATALLPVRPIGTKELASGPIRYDGGLSLRLIF